MLTTHGDCLGSPNPLNSWLKIFVWVSQELIIFSDGHYTTTPASKAWRHGQKRAHCERKYDDSNLRLKNASVISVPDPVNLWTGWVLSILAKLIIVFLAWAIWNKLYSLEWLPKNRDPLPPAFRVLVLQIPPANLPLEQGLCRRYCNNWTFKVTHEMSGQN